jgi:hypothetical protein
MILFVLGAGTNKIEDPDRRSANGRGVVFARVNLLRLRILAHTC